ncbi:polysaccharide deacetylase family protein [Larkinella soli]|uniref:polysaccharide deacetylase family protein n=1 Tax=Larkinella soli TaxID=1770527 RepID=UPI000FFBD51B|nr:polysaccharide deacetylase family protein [Larkinella soli]
MGKLIYYHGIYSSCPELSFSNPAFTLKDFERQIRLLSRRYELISLDEALARSTEKDGLKGTLCVTTDDGLADNLRFAEILENHQARFTLFLNNDFIDNRNLMWRNKVLLAGNRLDARQQARLIRSLSEKYRLPHPAHAVTLLDWSQYWPMALKDELADQLWQEGGLGTVAEFLEARKPYLTRAQIAEMVRKGHAIGAHTRSHPDCSLLSWEQLREETVDAVAALSALFDRPVRFLSYPFGRRPRPDWDRRVREESRTLKATLGITPRLRSGELEEREDMEKPFWKSLFYFYLMPLKRALF